MDPVEKVVKNQLDEETSFAFTPYCDCVGFGSSGAYLGGKDGLTLSLGNLTCGFGVALVEVVPKVIGSFGRLGRDKLACEPSLEGERTTV